MSSFSLINSLIDKFKEPEVIYSVGDIVRVIINNKTKQTALAYIRGINLLFFYCVEFFNYKPKQNYIITEQTTTLLDNVNILNNEHIAVINIKHIVRSVWTQNKSNKAIKSTKQYNHSLFVKAAKFGDIKLIQHII
eukprot:122006_1